MKLGITNAQEALSKAIINLHKPQPFFAHLCMHLRPRILPPEYPMQTMGVDEDGYLYYSEEFVMGLTDEEVKGVVCHEVLHVALLHFLRTGNRNKIIANVAQDVVVNMMVKKSGLKLPQEQSLDNPQGLIPYDAYNDRSEFKLGEVEIRIERVSEKAWEEVYAEIVQQFKQQNKQLPQPRGGRALGWDNHMESQEGASKGKQSSKRQLAEKAQKWQQRLAQAAQHAKQMGQIPGGMERRIDELLKPEVQWKQMLLKYLRPHITPVDWTYQRPNKKSKVLGVYLPNIRKESAVVEVIIDTSGSISRPELTEFFTEIVAIKNSMAHVSMHVNFVDTEISSRVDVTDHTPAQLTALRPTGGGGTDMENGLEQIRDEYRTDTPVVVVFTDGYTRFNKSARDFPFDVVWVINKTGIQNPESRINYGKVVKIDG